MFSNHNNLASRFTYMRFAGTLDYYKEDAENPGRTGTQCRILCFSQGEKLREQTGDEGWMLSFILPW